MSDGMGDRIIRWLLAAALGCWLLLIIGFWVAFAIAFAPLAFRIIF